MSTQNLLSEFPSISTQSWEQIIQRDLKGADYARKLLWQSDDGLLIKPYYRAEDIEGLEHLDTAPGDFPYLRGSQSTAGWYICEEIDTIDSGKANRAACSAVTAGAEKIIFLNVAIEDAADLEILDANLCEIPVHLENADEPQLRLLIDRLKKRPRLAPISTGWNPLGNLDFAAEITRIAPPGIVPFTIGGEEFEESGATAVEQAGFTLAAAADFLAEMQSREVDVDRAAASVRFSFAIDSNFFFEIAKLRAFRMVWAQVVEAFGGARESARAYIHARTSRWNKTVYDPHVNILRATTEAMSAVFGSADSISVAPFDECYRVPDEASRRLARNIQILLKEEALLSRVGDAGGGSYYLEVLTDSIAREAWKSLQEIESAGGYRKAHAEEHIEQILGRSNAAKEKAIVSRGRVFAGTNKFANPSEKALDRIDPSRIDSGRRATTIYEQLRLRTEAHVAKGGKCPHVLLAEIGDAKMRAARSGFAADFFACAGFEIVTQQFSQVENIAAIDADLIVLCSSDAEYLGIATLLSSALQSRGRETPMLVAGNPETKEHLLAAGVADFVHLRSNPIEFLSRWQQQLGIKD
jgi:methylmalonyl-CoA mutase